MLKRKPIFLLLSLLVVMALVSACGGAQPEATEAPAVAEPTEAPAEPAVVEGYECDDAFGCVEVADGDPIVIASALVVSGPNTPLGLDAQYGVEIALEYKGSLLGHPLELQAEDGGCSAEGGQTAATKIASNEDVVAVVGHNCSSSCTPAAPIYDDAGMTMVSPSCTAPSLTAPDLHSASLLRSCHNDSVQGKIAAEFAYNTLGARSAATIHDGSPYAEQLQAVFADSFKELGGEVTAQEAVNVGDTDMRPLLTSIATGSPDVLYYPIFIAEGGFITSQSAEVSGLENTILMGADGMQSPDFITAAGAAGENMYLTGPDLSFGNVIYDKFLETYQSKYGTAPVAPFHAHAFDATNMILNAIEKVAVESEGTLYIPRGALRDALYATSGMDGITGTLSCDANGDCADPKISVVQIQSGAFTRVWPEPEAAAAPAEGDMLVVSAECKDNKVKEIKAVDGLTVQFTMCKPDPAFLAKMAFTPFFIQPQEWIEETGGTGELLEHPIGTGPYMLESWNRGDSIIFKRFDDFWGEPAVAETLVFRWATEGAARLLELQAGTVDHIVKLSPDDYDAVQSDPNLQFLPVPNPNIMYLAMTNTFEPWGDVNVRKAIALGIDRQRIIDNFYPAGSEAASHFTPCSIPNACQGEAWYDFDPEAARALLAEAGFPDGFSTSIFYRDVFRVYLPEPGLVAVEIQSQLKENLNIDAEVVVMESGEFIAESTAGNLDGLYMLGWGADYLHVTNFLDFHFSRSNPQYGDPYPEVYEILEEASTIGDEAITAPMYEAANNALKEHIPMVPVAHGAPADAARADVQNAHTAVLGPPDLWNVDPGKDTLVYLKAAEPISLYCMDETDGESLDACKMVTEGLYKYDKDGVAQPTLATSCEANEDSTVWTCYLREGVKFHDGSTVDANDVVRSMDAGMNAASPYHVGNTGAFEYPSYLFDALMNLE